ncbi:MAG: N-acetylmuramoyl-L-alanine amidase [Acidobacteria bacterium]|nr:N-acetylmuramoyl-L-alanine amidase [Acidobacteriota bacterium]
MSLTSRLLMLSGLAVLLTATPALAQTAKVRYERALEAETAIRARLDAAADPTPAVRGDLLRQTTRVVTSFEAIVRRYPTTGYADNALWQGAQLAETAYRRFGRADDRLTASTLYTWLIREYPTSPLVRRARTQVNALEATRSVEASVPAPALTTQPVPAPPPPAAATSTPVPTMQNASAPTASVGSAARATLSDIQRSVLPDSVRVTLALDREVAYHEERIVNPDRVFFDLRGAQLATPLVDTVLSYDDDVVPQIRTGRHPNGTVRVVLDLKGVARYSVFSLYNPYRLVIDFERSKAIKVAQPTVTPPARVTTERLEDAPSVVITDDATPDGRASASAPPATATAARSNPAPASPAAATGAANPAPATPLPTDGPAAPMAPLANGAGRFSLSRQLGLSVSRIVIDPGHGGRDPGSNGHGVREADLTLDVALRLEKLLSAEPGVEVILTRRTNVYVPLEERTAIANREGADLFLSIHANAARNTAARGVETYYLSFASSPEAEAVAARENSASERAMHNLPDIIKAIALNNKLDESRDLAGTVQEHMITRLRKSNKDVRNLGVKKAPFVVLIGAAMPSVLAEISFLTNKQEAQLLKTAAYKQRIAEALFDGVSSYRKALKRQVTVADQRPEDRQ